MADPLEPPQFGVLGPLLVRGDGHDVALGGPKERTALAHLLARANQVVPAAALVESLWPEGPPPTAERTLQAYVARLRKALEPSRPLGVDSGILVRAGPGYRLRVEREQVDSLLFEHLAVDGARLLRDGDRAALEALRQAGALWRGDAFSEFVAVEACEAEARRLEEMRLVAVEDRFDAELAAGAASALVADLEALVAVHEFRERLWGQLMVALYRSGRQRDALSAYARARTVLVEQLGIEPGRELRALEVAILEQDPALDLHVVGGSGFGLPAPLASVGPAFVGRESELAWLRTAWLDAADGRGGFVSVLGPEGMGKTRLVAELAREVQRAGGVVLYAGCGGRGWALGALLGDALGDASTPIAGGDLGQAVMQTLATQFEGRPVLLVVDDAHLADDTTIHVLAELAAWSGAGSLLVVATFRADANGSDAQLPANREAGAHLVLHGLDRGSIQRVCDVYAVGVWWPDDIDRMLERTGGVPLHVHEVASELARERAVRQVGDAADRSAATQARLVALRSEIVQSVEGIQHVLEQRRANLAARQASLGGADARRPYKGLVAFEAGDAAEFFGRERLVAELVARMAGARLVAVVGASGSGKSSLVRAGLLPALTAGVLPVAGGWLLEIETPNDLTASERPARDGAPPTGRRGRRLLFVDQFEELFTTGLDRNVQAQFVDRVVAAANDPAGCVVLAVRADHLDQCIAFTDLAALIAGNEVLLGPMTDGELRRAIEGPARRAGVEIEPGLVDVVIADVAGRPGALPLLSTALVETWERRAAGVLTLQGYREAGGVNGALARLAEETYCALDPAQQDAIRRLLERLCDAEDHRSLDLRRRVPLADTASDDAARESLAAFVDRRLLVVDQATVEVAHEALFREWPRLRGWLDENAQGRLVHQRVAESASAWTVDQDPSGLYRGTRLDSALEWADEHAADVTEAEQAFLDASAQAAARELDEAMRRAAEKTRNNRRLRGLLIATGVLLVAALVAGVLFVRQRERAEQQARRARARELAGAATLAIGEDPERATLLAIEAMRTTQDAGEGPLPEALSALQQATQANRLLYHRDEAALFVDASRDGRYLATRALADPGATLIWDAASGVLLRTLPAEEPGSFVTDLQFSPDGGVLAVASGSKDRGDEWAVAITLWDTGGWSERGELPAPGDGYTAFSFSPDGQRMAALTDRGGSSRITIWDVPTTSAVLAFDFEGRAGQPLFLPDGSALVVPEDEALGFYSTGDGRLLRDVPTPGFTAVTAAIHAGTGKVALASQDSREVQIRDLASGDLDRRLPVTDAGPLDWSPDGTRLSIAGANEGPIHIVDVASGEDAVVLAGHASGSWDATYLPDGERVASVGYTGELRVWDVTPDGPPSLGAIAPRSGAPWTLDISPDGSELVVSTLGHTIERLDAETGELLARRADQLTGQLPYFTPVSADWRYVGSVEESDGKASVLALDALAPTMALPACTSPAGFSPDGALLALSGGGGCANERGYGSVPPPPGVEMRSRIIDVGTGREILDLGDRYPLYYAVFNPGGALPPGRYVAIHGADKTQVDLFDLVEGRLIGSVPTPDQSFNVAFDPTGRWLAGGTAEGRVWVLDLPAVAGGASPEDAIVFNQTVDVGGVPRLALTANGTLATAGFGREVRLWDIPTGKILVELRTAPAKGLPAVAFTPDGSDLLYSDGPVLRRYPLDSDALVRRARDALTRELTDDECRRYLQKDCPNTDRS